MLRIALCLLFLLVRPLSAGAQSVTFFIHGWGDAAGMDVAAEVFRQRGDRVCLAKMAYADPESVPVSRLTGEALLADARTQLADCVAGMQNPVITVVGHSAGGYVAALLSGVEPVAMLVLYAPASYEFADVPLSHWIGHPVRHPEMVAWRRRSMLPQENKAFRAVNISTARVVVVWGSRDELVPYPSNYLQAAGERGRVRTIRGAGHGPNGDLHMRQIAGMFLAERAKAFEEAETARILALETLALTTQGR